MNNFINNSAAKSAPTALIQANAVKENALNSALTAENQSQLEEKCKYIDNLTAFGVFTDEQAQILKQNLIKEMNNNQPKVNNGNVFSEFEKENPNFFKSRNNLKNYLEKADVTLDKDEFNKIAAMVDELEKQAVERYQEELTYAQMLKEANKKAIERLKTSSYRAGSNAVDAPKTFTAAQIGAMSREDFQKYEKVIMEQMLKGKIK